MLIKKRWIKLEYDVKLHSNSMKILYDGIIYNTQPTGGINRYFANLIDGLPEDIQPSLTTYEIPPVTWPQSSKLKVLRYKKFRPRRISNKMEQLYFDRVANPKNYDVFHPTYYAPLVSCDWNGYDCPIVITVYDMIHELFADEMDSTGKFAQEKQCAVEAAQAILCISEHTKADLIRYCKVPEDKITVTYLAADLNADLSHGDEEVPSRPYFLYLGTRTSYKNFIGLIDALSVVVKTCNDFTLCVVGSPFTNEERRTIEYYNLSDNIEHIGYADDPYLAKLYRCSLAFVYPSLYEGFGIPPLEAMQCGTVVVAANTSSVPEVVGDGGILFDPRARGELADILLSLLDGSTAREPIIARGQERAKLFSWEKTVAQTVEVYRALAR